MPPLTFDGPSPAAKSGPLTFDAPPSPPPPSFMSKLADNYGDIPREIGHEFMESTRANQDLVRQPYSPALDTQIGPVSPRMAQILLNDASAAGAPLTGFLTSVLGRPVEKATGIPKETVGADASMLIPFADEAGMAVAASKLAKEAGITVDAARAMIEARRAAPKIPGPPKRPELARNVKALEQLDIKPSLAVASTNQRTRGITQTVGQNYFAGSPVRRAIDRTAKGFQAAWEKASGGALAPAAAGERVQAAVDRFANAPPSVKAALAAMSPETRIATGDAARSLPSQRIGFGVKAENLYGRAEALIGPQNRPIQMPATRAAITDIMQKFRNQDLSELFNNPVLASLRDAIENGDSKLSFDDARRLRTEIRTRLLGDPQLRSTINEAEIKNLYGAMTRDLQDGSQALGGTKAGRAWTEADKFYRAGLDRIDNALGRYYGPKATPASVFHDLIGAAQGGARQDLDRLNQVRRSLPPEDWKMLQGAIIDRMGRALPGQASEETPFSIATFMTNVNKLEPPGVEGGPYRQSGLRVLFGRAGEEGATTEQEQTVRNLRHVASQWRELEKLKNFSRSGEQTGNILVGSGLLTGVMTHHPLGAVMALTTGNGASALIGDPSFVRWLAGIPANGTPAETQAAVRALAKWLPATSGAAKQAQSQ